MDLSILSEIMRVRPLVMFGTEVSSYKRSFAETGGVASKRFVNSLQNTCYFFGGVWRGLLSALPYVRMILLHMFAITLEKLKVFYSIVSSYSIDVMNTLVLSKFSPQVLFHNITMMKHSFTIYVNTKVSVICKVWFPFFKHCPVRGNIIATVPVKSTSMHSADLAVIPLENTATTFNSAYLSFSHMCIVAQREQNVK